MVHTVIMPRLDMQMESGQVSEWLVKEGDTVKKGEPIAKILTEKVTYELESPATGVLYKVIVPQEEEVPIGQIIAVIMETGDSPSSVDQAVKEAEKSLADLRAQAPMMEKKEEKVVFERPPAPTRAPEKRIKISPIARKLAKKHGIDVTKIVGTGPGGRITKTDVMALVEMKAAPVEEEVVPLTGVRKVMAKRLSYSARTYAWVWSSWEVDATDLVELRRKLRPQWEKAGLNISFTAFVVKAVAKALKENPIFNSSLQDGNIVIQKNYNVGVATAVSGETFQDSNLLVGVVRDADKKGLAEIASRLLELREKADQKTLTMGDVSGSTFTVSNVGSIWRKGSIFTSLINPPESAILGVGSIVQKPVVREGKIIIRSMMQLNLTTDHRIIYPTDTVKFSQKLTQLLENPITLLDESVIASKT